MWLDAAFVWSSVAAEAVLFGLLMQRSAYTRRPIFTLWMLWCVISDLLGMYVRFHYGDSTSYFHFYMYEMPLDSLLQFGVLVELSWSVLRPLQASLPRWTLLALSVLILLAGAAVWPLAGSTVMHDLAKAWYPLLRLQQTFSLLRILFFLALAGGSQLLSLGWRDRELQIATGLGFYSLVSLAVSLLHAQMPSVAHYHLIDQIMSGSYLCVLMYWGVCFIQKEVPRQEFSPRMQSFLLRVSGAAHTSRVALENHSMPGDRRQ